MIDNLKKQVLIDSRPESLQSFDLDRVIRALKSVDRAKYVPRARDAYMDSPQLRTGTVITPLFPFRPYIRWHVALKLINVNPFAEGLDTAVCPY